MSALGLAGILACAGTVDVSWHEEDGYRWRELDVPRRGEAGFTLLDPSSTGINFVNAVSESLLVQNRILAQGGGVCLGDVDGDGRVDVFLARTDGANALYRNLGGWQFEEIAARAGVDAPDRYSTGCAFVDVNGNGRLDLILLALGGPNALYLNDGTGSFTASDQAVLRSTAGSTTVAASDVDGDGWIDLYVTNYKAYTTLDRISPQERSFDQVVRQVGPRRFEVRERYRSEYNVVERAELGGISLVQRADPDAFLRNAGGGNFEREAIAGNQRFLDEDGRPLAQEPEYFGLAGMLADMDGDGFPDLYVANDFEDPDLFWRNDGRGGFRLVPRHAVRASSNSAMAVDVADVNRNGLPDIFVVDMLSSDTRRLKTQVPTHTAVPKRPGLLDDRPQMQRNTLQLNRGDGTFAEVARLAGVGASGWSWSTVLLDVDLDGWEDILVGTGHLWDVMDGDTQYRLRNRLHEIDWRRMLFEYPPLPLRNVAFRNRGDLTFEDASTAWRFDVGEDISHGMAFADLDGDGDLDVVINRLGKPAAVLRNDATAPRVAVRLSGEAPNTAGIGARVRVLGGAVPEQQREVIAGGRYLSHSDMLLAFGTGSASSVTIEVLWRDGRRSMIQGALPNRLYEISQRSASLLPGTLPQQGVRQAADPAGPSTLFTDASQALGGHVHADPYFDDFQRQLLLPSAMSQLGPGAAWVDVNGDGWEDLVIGAGRTGTLAWFQNERGRLWKTATPFAPAHVDLATVLGWPDGRGGHAILTGVSSYEMATMEHALGVPSVVAYAPANGSIIPLVPGDTGSVGPLAAADYNGDGTLDLFVGARVIPRSYPIPPSSRLYRSEAGRLVLDTANTRLFARLGMVSAASFADLTGNGWPDLVVALEWGPIRVFVNDRGRFRPVEFPGLTDLPSRWNGLATGDLDGDGRLDIVATSWGRNVEHQATRERPLLLYGFMSDRGAEVMLARHDPRIRAASPLHTYARTGLALPSAALRLRTFASFADASVQEVLGPRGANALELRAETLDHMVFLNRGRQWERNPLPAMAQEAPAFYVGIADFDGDGFEDVFLSQNFFPTEVATPRYDAGRSLLLRGDGKGGLTPVPGHESGLLVYGDQRGAAYADFDGDGRLDIVVTQNAAATRLFRNVGAHPGVRVRIMGPSGNPSGVGTQLRLSYDGRSGPVREIQAGSGYWSQNGAVQVLGRSGEPEAVWVRWPGGATWMVQLPGGEASITIRAP